MCASGCFFFFFFNDTATTEIYTLSLHDALPIHTSLPIPYSAVPRALRHRSHTEQSVLDAGRSAPGSALDGVASGYGTPHAVLWCSLTSYCRVSLVAHHR